MALGATPVYAGVNAGHATAAVVRATYITSLAAPSFCAVEIDDLSGTMPAGGQTVVIKRGAGYFDGICQEPGPGELQVSGSLTGHGPTGTFHWSCAGDPPGHSAVATVVLDLWCTTQGRPGSFLFELDLLAVGSPQVDGRSGTVRQPVAGTGVVIQGPSTRPFAAPAPLQQDVDAWLDDFAFHLTVFRVSGATNYTAKLENTVCAGTHVVPQHNWTVAANLASATLDFDTPCGHFHADFIGISVVPGTAGSFTGTCRDAPYALTESARVTYTTPSTFIGSGHGSATLFLAPGRCV